MSKLIFILATFSCLIFNRHRCDQGDANNFYERLGLRERNDNETGNQRIVENVDKNFFYHRCYNANSDNNNDKKEDSTVHT